MRKLLILTLILCSYESFTQARDTLFVENGLVWYNSMYGSLVEANKDVHRDFFAVYGKDGLVTIKNNGKKVMDVSSLDKLYLNGSGAVTIAQKKAWLESKKKGFEMGVASTAPQTGTIVTTNTPYTTDGNTIALANVRVMIIENVSETVDATFTYGGNLYKLGSKSSGSNSPFQRVFEAFFDQNSKKYAPFATTIVNALGSNVYVTLTFAQP